MNSYKARIMQKKFEIFNELPVELELETAKNLSDCDLVSWAQASKYHLALFKPMVDVRKLLHYAVHGKHDAVQLILTDDISSMFKRDKVTDCSGREFECVSGFEYSLWALDKHMWTKMIACIPQNEEGRKVFAKLIAQYNKINTEGVTYKLNGKTITEQHFDFNNTIIKELQTEMDLMNAPGGQDWDAMDYHWREGVGGAQKLLPMHIVDEYCSNEPFYPVPEFTSQPKSSRQYYNCTTDKYENWFSIDSELSVDFAISKCANGYGINMRAESYRSSSCGCPVFDLDAMKALCKIRTNDFIELKSELENQMTLANSHQVSQI